MDGRRWSRNAGPGAGRRWRLTCSALALSAAGTTAADALDLNVDGVDRYATPALQESLRTWDSAKTYGAERVIDRDRKMYLPDGIRAGNFVIFPSLGSTVLFDDNVFATAANRKSDIRVDLLPSVKVRSDLPRHVLDFSAGGRIATYARHEDLSHNDVFGRFDGVLHFDHAHTLSASVLSELSHEDRIAFEAPKNAREKTPVWHNRAVFGLKRDAGRLHGSFSLTAESWDYQDVQAFDGSTVDQDHRDLAVFSSQLKAGYRFSPGYELQGKVRALRQYNRGTPTLDYDGTGYEAVVGLALETNPLVRWHLLGGYGIRDWDQENLPTTGATLLEGQLQWLATQQTTVYVTARRALSEGTTGEEIGGGIDTSLAGKVEHELWRNLVFTLDGEYRHTEYIGSPRRDQLYIGRIGFDYYHTKNWLFSLGYEHKHRQSNIDDNDLIRNTVWVGAKLRF